MFLHFNGKIDITKTFECGQIFRFFNRKYLDEKKSQLTDFFETPQKPQGIKKSVKSSDKKPKKAKTIYYGPFKNRIIKVIQVSDDTIEVISSDPDENDKSQLSDHKTAIDKKKKFEDDVKIFFRINDDLKAINEFLRVIPNMKKIVDEAIGLHLLKQDFFECGISYILSQQNSIPRITANLEKIARKFGKHVKFDNYDFFLFPTYEELKNATEEDFKGMSLGYRAKYVVNFTRSFPTLNKIYHEDCENNDCSDRLGKELLNIHGIGNKVMECISLFSCGDLRIFPVDVWINRFMVNNFFEKEERNNILKKQSSNSKSKNIKLKPTAESLRLCRQLGHEIFGEYAGYAQEYIFYYARNKGINLNTK
ncbi:MAG: DNA-3-methyladenine glycosylase 2 [Promethearchaeota archaeon]